MEVVSSSIPQLVPVAKQPDYDKEFLTPFHEKQVRIAKEKRAAAMAECANAGGSFENETCVLPPPTVVEAPVVVMTQSDDIWSGLRNCEAGGEYAKNTGNGYFGAYQFDLKTWAGYGGYTRPSDAPPAVQDAKAQQVQATRGWSPWPACARKLGLSGNT